MRPSKQQKMKKYTKMDEKTNKQDYGKMERIIGIINEKIRKSEIVSKVKSNIIIGFYIFIIGLSTTFVFFLLYLFIIVCIRLFLSLASFIFR